MVGEYLPKKKSGEKKKWMLIAQVTVFLGAWLIGQIPFLVSSASGLLIANTFKLGSNA